MKKSTVCGECNWGVNCVAKLEYCGKYCVARVQCGESDIWNVNCVAKLLCEASTVFGD